MFDLLNCRLDLVILQHS